MLPISICMIAKNEERYLEECLQRLSNLNCELIFVDTGSTDNTVAIAKRYTPHVFFFKWIDDFSAVRNFAADKASNDWILAIDCDEYLDNPETMHSLLDTYMDTLKEQTNCVGVVTIRSLYQQAGTSSIVHGHPARFYSRSLFHYEGRVHEQVFSLSKESFSIFQTPFSFYHMGYSNADILKKKATRNIELLLNLLEEKGPNPYVYFQLGQSYQSTLDYKTACHYFDMGLSFDLDPNLEYVQQMVEGYGYSLINQNLLAEALQLENIYDSFSIHADFVFLMGLIYMKNARFEEAIAEFSKATTLSAPTVEGVNSFLANYNIGVIYECSGQTSKALTYYRRCGSYSPAHTRITALSQR